MSNPTIAEDMEPVLNLIPLKSASDTIRSFCMTHEKCEECQLFGLRGNGCYFLNSVPCNWDLSSIIYDQTKETEKQHKLKGRKT